MKAITDIILPEDLQYTMEHVWVKKEDDTYFVGISDFAQDQLGELVFVELPEIGDTFMVNTPFGVVESLKSVNSLFMPFDGEIVGINTTLEDTPTLINVDCYTKGWIVRIRENLGANKGNLLSPANYKMSLEK